MALAPLRNPFARTAAVGAACLAAFAVGSGLPAAADEVRIDPGEIVLTDASQVEAAIDRESQQRGTASSAAPAADDPVDLQVAQFELDKPKRKGEAPPSLVQRLEYQYSYGSESEVEYRINPDLNNRVYDDSLVLVPQLNGLVIYRPADWLETTLEMIIEREIPAVEKDVVTLPSGERQFAEKRRFSLLVDQALVTLKGVTDPFEFSLGRRNYEDERHWLYDQSMDIARAALKLGTFRAEATAGRGIGADLDLLKRERKDRINTYMLYADYRGIEDIKVAGYTVLRDDQAKREGRPLLMGLRSLGMPSDTFSYWIELAHLAGRNEAQQRISAHAFDVGGTYRFLGLPLNPNVTLGYAFATGDRNPNDRRNNDFRQTGLQSNEAKFAGVSEFRTYGEALDPEFSNLKILTVGLGFRPEPNVSVDIVYHRYWLDELAEELRNVGLTAEMNQVELRPSRDVGSALDFVLGFRSLFGVKRLGLDFRAGLFFPGEAFLRDDGTEENPILRDADEGVSLIAKFWW